MLNQHHLLDHQFQPASDVLFCEADGEGVLLHLNPGTYYSLSETSLLVWQGLQNQTPLDAIVETILAEYDISREQVLQELKDFLEGLLTLELIFIAPTAD